MAKTENKRNRDRFWNQGTNSSWVSFLVCFNMICHPLKTVTTNPIYEWFIVCVTAVFVFPFTQYDIKLIHKFGRISEWTLAEDMSHRMQNQGNNNNNSAINKQDHFLYHNFDISCKCTHTKSSSSTHSNETV